MNPATNYPASLQVGRWRVRRIFVWIGSFLCAVNVLAMAACLRWTFIEVVADKYVVALTGGVLMAQVTETAVDSLVPRSTRFRLPLESVTHIRAVWSQYPALPTYTSSWGIHTLVVPLWLPLIFLAIPSAILWRFDRRRPAPGTRKCGYDLTGNTSGRCPECGEFRAAMRR